MLVSLLKENAVLLTVDVELFGGQLKSKITCLACKYVSSTFDPFLDVSLPIPRLRVSYLLYRSLENTVNY